jgi:dolichyl-phosphooligosaccharide-protein glycotransferase
VLRSARDMLRHLALLAAIAAIALVIRIYPVYESVLGSGEVNFLETDAFYHVRLVENQVRNYPWRVTLDPYAMAGGQYVPIAPLYDALTSTAVVLLHGRHATASQIERLAAYGPPVIGMCAVVAAWGLGAMLFGARAGLLGAALLATAPGHFLDRTMLGFVDHHALEAFLTLLTLLALVWAGRAAPGWRASVAPAAVAGAALGLYLLAWASGAFLVAILGAWLLVVVVQTRRHEEIWTFAQRLLIVSLVALLLVLVFQDSGMYRYGTQILSLSGLAMMALAVMAASRVPRVHPATLTLIGAAVTIGASILAVWVWNPALLQQVTSDLLRLSPDPSRMGVREARPLFMYSGVWRWREPWELFGVNFYIGVLALVLFTHTVWREDRPDYTLVWVFAVASLAATVGQNRFGYYLVPALAIVIGWLGGRVLAWSAWLREPPGEPRHAAVLLQREMALSVVAAIVIVPGVTAAHSMAGAFRGTAAHWLDAAFWLRQHTPEPFAAMGGDYYYARYGSQVPTPDYTIMNWWDYGYLITQRARRVPVANPTQEHATRAARFYVETDETRAAAMMHEERARYVLVDFEQLFRYAPDGRVLGQFEAILDWTGRPRGDYYQVCFRRGSGGWTPVWLFLERYYRSMIFRLMAGGGAPVAPRKVSVVSTVDRVDTAGTSFCELQNEQTFSTYEEAQRVTSSAVIGRHIIAGLDPAVSPFPLEALRAFARIEDFAPDQRPLDPPRVRVFLLKDDAAR